MDVFMHHYCWPPGFYVDERYDGDDPFITDATIESFNAEKKITNFINYV